MYVHILPSAFITSLSISVLLLRYSVHCCSVCLHDVCVLLDRFLVHWSGAQLTLFGSSANGFGHPASDLDLCLTLNEETEVPWGVVVCIGL